MDLLITALIVPAIIFPVAAWVKRCAKRAEEKDAYNRTNGLRCDYE